MKCPLCGEPASAWPWMDGGYKGIECKPCKKQWWSDTFSENAYDAEKKAIQQLLEEIDFPEDAQDTDEYQRQIFSTDMCIGMSEENAIKALREFAWRVRVVRKDGIPAVVTRDYRTDRANLEIVDGIVVSCKIG